MNLNFLFLHATEGDNTRAIWSIEQTLRLLFPKQAEVKFHFKYWLTQLNSDGGVWIITASIVKNTSYPNQNSTEQGNLPLTRTLAVLLPMQTNQVIMGSN